MIASDILPMESLPGVTFIEGDFTDEAVFTRILSALGEKPVDLVLSDMAPNMSGVNAVDQPRAIYLAELALDMAQKVLAPGGAFVVKFALTGQSAQDRAFTGADHHAEEMIIRLDSEVIARRMQQHAEAAT